MSGRSVSLLCVAVASLLLCVACDVIDEEDEALLQKAKNDQYSLIKKDELAELHRQADLGKSVGRFQIYRAGFRTFRLDTATGSTCILLATDADCKNPDTSAQGCQYVSN